MTSELDAEPASSLASPLVDPLPDLLAVAHAVWTGRTRATTTNNQDGGGADSSVREDSEEDGEGEGEDEEALEDIEADDESDDDELEAISVWDRIMEPVIRELAENSGMHTLPTLQACL